MHPCGLSNRQTAHVQAEIRPEKTWSVPRIYPSFTPAAIDCTGTAGFTGDGLLITALIYRVIRT